MLGLTNLKCYSFKIRSLTSRWGRYEMAQTGTLERIKKQLEILGIDYQTFLKEGLKPLKKKTYQTKHKTANNLMRLHIKVHFDSISINYR